MTEAELSWAAGLFYGEELLKRREEHHQAMQFLNYRGKSQ